MASTLALACDRAAAAGPLEYSYEVARFEVDGNVLGPQDGVPDFVDEFAGTSIGPNWYQAFGTVSEHDGSLFLTSPGTVYPSPTGGTTTVSIAAGASGTWVYDGDGNFTATAFWEPIIPTEGYHYHFSLFTFGGGSGGIFSEIFGIGFGGINGGLSMEQHRTEIDQSQGVYQNTLLDYLPISATQITGRIGMRLDYDDVTNEAWTSFSLDGGLTWQSPFPHGPVFVGRTTGQFLLSADPSSDAPPPCTEVCCQALAAAPKSSLMLRRIGTDPTPGNDRLSLKATASLPPAAIFADVHPDTDGARLVVRGQPSGTVLLDLAIPPGVFAGRGSAGWRSAGDGRIWSFADKRAVAASGVRRMMIADRSQADGTGLVKIAIKTAGGTYALAPSDVALDVAIVLGDDADALAGLCGARSYAASDCVRNAQGTALRCQR